MTRSSLALALLFAPTALAGNTVDVQIAGVVAPLNLSIENTSGSPDPLARKLTLTSGDPLVSVGGQFDCPYGGDVDSVELMFGTVFIHFVNPPLLNTTFAWDSSPTTHYQGGGDDAGFQIDYNVDLPESWDGGFNFHFNPVEVVESHLATFVNNGGDMVDFLKTDDVFESKITVNAVAWCAVGNDLVPGLASREVTVYVFYKGDPTAAWQPVAGGPGGVTAGDPPTPPGYDPGTGTGDPTDPTISSGAGGTGGTGCATAADCGITTAPPR